MTYGHNSVTPSLSAPESGKFGQELPGEIPSLVPGRALYDEYHHKARLTVFSDGSCTLAACDFPIFAEAGYTMAGYGDDRPPRRRGVDSAANVDRAIRRARSEMRQLLRNNALPWFVTLTFDPAKIDRYDPREIVRRVGYWCDNAVRRKGLAYALVPEYHTQKEGEETSAIHFHGFFNSALPMVDSGHQIGGRKVYNCPAWTFGFSACEQVEDNTKALAYALKYVGKGRDKIGGRWWYHGGALEPPKSYLLDIDAGALEAMGGHVVHIDRLNTDLVLLDVPADRVEGVLSAVLDHAPEIG